MSDALGALMSPAVGGVLGVVVVVAIVVAAFRLSKSVVNTRLRRAVKRSIKRFEVRLERYKLVSRGSIRRDLMSDPAIQEAISCYAEEHGVSEFETRLRVEDYVDEIVPFFNVLSYYRFGYNIARIFVNLLYRPKMKYLDRAGIDRIPRGDVVVYLMNHRSNADYIVVAYLLAHEVSISYAVGEWARVWPLEYVFKSFGSYFIRRRYREPLYHRVLERYVQSMTRNGVTQGIFLEGGLSRNGALRQAKIGLLDYIARTTTDPAFDRNVWFVPTAINYDRVLEDRTLIKELIDREYRQSTLRRMLRVGTFLAVNIARMLTFRLKRYGRVAVNFGSPVSLAEWAERNPGVFDLAREERLPEVQKLADEILGKIKRIIPVTPVPLVAAAVLSFGETLVRRDALTDRVSRYLDHLETHHPQLHPGDAVETLLDRAWRTFRMRRLVVREGDSYVVLPAQRGLLEYYANSIRRLLPEPERRIEMHPARDHDDTHPGLSLG